MALHGIIDQPIDDEFITLMKRNRAVYVPTLALFEDVADIAAWVRRQQGHERLGLFPAAVYESLASTPAKQRWEKLLNNTVFTRERLPVLRANLKKAYDAGILVVAGTDTGFQGVLLGVATHVELLLMVEAGLKPRDVIRAATINAARMAGRDRDLGSIEPGKLADLVILDANPLDDIRNVTRMHRVMSSGTAYEPSILLQMANR